MSATWQVSGTTQVVFVVGDPVRQVRTPQAQNAVWRERGLDIVTVPARIAADELPRFMESLRVDQSVAGAVITVPHKQTVVRLCDEVGMHARAANAVNAVRRSADGRLIGETFDGLGFVEGLRKQGHDPKEMAVVLHGAGGAASAIALALLSSGVSSLSIENRTMERANALASRLRKEGYQNVTVGDTDRQKIDLVINATSRGMTPESSTDFDLRGYRAQTVAADVVVAAAATPFLSAALQRGLIPHEGKHMLEGQIQLISDYLAGEA